MDNIDAINKIKFRIETESRIVGADKKAFGDLEMAIQALKNQERIIEILRDQRFTDETCIDEIAKIVGIHV